MNIERDGYPTVRSTSLTGLDLDVAKLCSPVLECDSNQIELPSERRQQVVLHIPSGRPSTTATSLRRVGAIAR